MSKQRYYVWIANEKVVGTMATNVDVKLDGFRETHYLEYLVARLECFLERLFENVQSSEN